MENREYLLWLCCLDKIPQEKKQKLMRYFLEADRLFHAGKRELAETGILSAEEIEFFVGEQKEERIRSFADWLSQKGISFCCREDHAYPYRLLEIYDPPLGLFYKGRLPLENPVSLAIVGARACSNYGKEQAYHFAQVLAMAGLQIISGLARGVDSFAHGGALHAGGRTFAVLGCGVDIVYPPEHERIYREILQEGGILSEYPPGTLPYRFHFPRRNRIISGLSQGVLVIEARKQSGSLITADLALEQGRDVFALPGRAGDALSMGTNRLIKQGAELVDQPEDILGYYQVGFAKKREKKDLSLETTEKIVYAKLSFEEKHLDRLAQETGMGTGKLMEVLLGLEEKGLAGQTGLYFHRTGKECSSAMW